MFHHHHCWCCKDGPGNMSGPHHLVCIVEAVQVEDLAKSLPISAMAHAVELESGNLGNRSVGVFISFCANSIRFLLKNLGGLDEILDG